MTQPSPTSLAPADLLAEASARTGLSDFGDEAFRAPFERLLAALESEARLTEIGRITQRERIVGILVNRLRTEQAYRQHPEIAEQAIVRPCVIVGLARTGTTMLHRTIASDPRWLSLLWWESRNPAPFPDSDGKEPDPRIADAEREVEAMVEGAPDLMAVHPMDAHAPDEEIMLLEHSFMSWNPEAFNFVPEFGRWLEGEDQHAAYAYLERLLQLLQWQKRRRGETAERWILKAPQHLGFLDLLFETFPDAQVVQTHRDPVQTVPSLASMVHVILELASDATDKRRTGEVWGAKMARAMRKALADRAAHEDRFLDLDYRALVAEPIPLVRRIYDFVGMPWTPEAEEGMKQWAVENARDQRPVHRYTLDEFGFSEDGLARDFTEYRARFLAD